MVDDEPRRKRTNEELDKEMHQAIWLAFGPIKLAICLVFVPFVWLVIWGAMKRKEWLG